MSLITSARFQALFSGSIPETNTPQNMVVTGTQTGIRDCQWHLLLYSGQVNYANVQMLIAEKQCSSVKIKAFVVSKSSHHAPNPEVCNVLNKGFGFHDCSSSSIHISKYVQV